MRFKIDENVHPDAAQLLRDHTHDAMTVYEQGLQGHADGAIAAVCRREDRALITLDLDFSDVRVYPPDQYPGLVVLRLVDQSRPAVLRVLTRVLPLFDREPLAKRLWIVDDHQVRVRGEPPNA